MIAIGSAALGQAGDTTLRTGTLVTVNGKTTIQLTVPLAGGPVMSVQPNGSLQGRPVGADGVYEICVIEGTTAVYAPSYQGVTYPWKFLFSPVLPA